MATSANYWEPEESNEAWLPKDGASTLFVEVECCQFCLNTMLEDIKVDTDLTIKRCPECEWHFGLDDFSDLDEINNLLADHMDKLCQCGNSDLNKFVLHQDGNSFTRQCCECMSETPVDFSVIQQHLSESTVIDMDPIIKCPNCENRIQACFTQMFNGMDNNNQPLAARCLICETEWILGDIEEEPFTLTCECGNSTEDCFAICRNNGYVMAVKCLICDRESLANGSDNLEQKWQVSSPKCHCGNDNRELLVHQYIGNHISVKCVACDSEWITEHFKTSEKEYSPLDSGRGFQDERPVGRTGVTAAKSSSTVPKRIIKGLQIAREKLATKASSTVPKLINEGLDMALEKLAKLSVKKILKKVLAKSPRVAARVCAVATFGFEIGTAIRNISKCYHKHKNGELSDDMFFDEVVDIVLQAAMTLIGGVVALIFPGIGFLLSPIIALIGYIVAKLLARFISFIRRKVKNHKWDK